MPRGVQKAKEWSPEHVNVKLLKGKKLQKNSTDKRHAAHLSALCFIDGQAL